MFNVNLDKPAKIVKALWDRPKDERRQPRQNLVLDGYWLEVESVSDAAIFTEDLHLPLRLCKACKLRRFVGTGYE